MPTTIVKKDTTSHDIVLHGWKQQDQHQHNDKCDAFFGGEQGYYCYPWHCTWKQQQHWGQHAKQGCQHVYKSSSTRGTCNGCSIQCFCMPWQITKQACNQMLERNFLSVWHLFYSGISNIILPKNAIPIGIMLSAMENLQQVIKTISLAQTESASVDTDLMLILWHHSSIQKMTHVKKPRIASLYALDSQGGKPCCSRRKDTDHSCRRDDSKYTTVGLKPKWGCIGNWALFWPGRCQNATSWPRRQWKTWYILRIVKVKMGENL